MAKIPQGSRLISGWRGYLNYERGLSDNTIDAYVRDVRLFVAFLDKSHITIARVTADAVVRFSREQAESGVSLTTIGRRIASVRQFLQYLHENGELSVAVHQQMDQVKRAEYLPRVLNQPQIGKLIRESGKRRADAPHSTAIALRDQAIVEFLYATGARVSEAASLTFHNLNVDDGWVRLFGKGSKERRVRIGSFAIVALKRWISARKELCRRINEAVFITTRGNAMDRTAIWRIVKKNSKRAGLGEISPHTLRHSCATHLLINGCNLRTVQEILGHSDVTTTQKYLHLDIRQLKKCHSKFHPRP